MLGNLTFSMSSSGKGIYSKYLIIDLNGGAPLTTRERILLAYPLGAIANNTYVAVQKGVVFDKLGRPCQAVDLESALVASPSLGFRSDYMPPSLLSWRVDMTLGQVTFLFDEAINGSSVQVSAENKEYNICNVCMYTFT